MRKPLIDIKIRKMSVKKPEVDISDVDICELCYLAALIDGEGAIGIHGRDLYPHIRIGMRSLLPYKLCKKHGGCITKSYSRGAPFYTWDVYDKSLLRGLVSGLVPHSKIKKRQLQRLLYAIKIRNSKSPGWKEEMLKTKEEIARLNKQRPPDIDLESGEEEDVE